jgi:hypothetical protein
MIGGIVWDFMSSRAISPRGIGKWDFRGAAPVRLKCGGLFGGDRHWSGRRHRPERAVRDRQSERRPIQFDVVLPPEVPTITRSFQRKSGELLRRRYTFSG